MTTILIFIVALGILVTVHEWGHFIVAKKLGVRVDVFSIGFGPKLLGYTWHGTEYRISPIPFGGYVKIYGQEPYEEADGDPVKAEAIARDPESFCGKPLYKKLGVVFAGPVMNLVLCFFLLPLVFMVGRLEPKILVEPPVVIDVLEASPAQKAGFKAGDRVISFNGKKVQTWRDLILKISLHPDETVPVTFERDGVVQTIDVALTTQPHIRQKSGFLGIEPFEFFGNEPLVDSVRPGSPADKGGIKPGDLVVGLNGQPVKYWTRMTRMIQDNKDKPLKLTVLRDGKEVRLTVIPEFHEESGLYRLGITKKIQKEDFMREQHGLFESVALGTSEFKRLFLLTCDILWRLFTGQLSLKTLGGPLQIAQATSSAARSGFGDFLYLLAFLSMQLGILNLLPIPILDGGHVAFIAIEGIRRRPLSPRIKSVSMQLGLVLLLGLMVLVTINDVDTLWPGFFEGIRDIF